MPQSLTKLYAHLIFSTKNRDRWLDASIRSRVHGHLATVLRDLGSPWVVIGGVEDHVHIVFDIGKKSAPVKIVEHIKRESSKFVKSLAPQYSGFYWQSGYGMFSVSPRDRDEAERYVRSQEEHHRNRSFQDEYRAILQAYGIDFDEQYLWD